MLKIEEYRREAQKLRNMAAKESNPEAKAVILDLAVQYDALAAKCEEYLNVEEEIRMAKQQRSGD